MEFNRENQKEKLNGQTGLFDGANAKAFNNKGFSLSPVPPASKLDKLRWEKELLGLFITFHPLEDYRKFLEKKTFPVNKIVAGLPPRLIRIGGIISQIKKIVTKNGQPMLFLTLEDLTSKIEVVVFPSVLERNLLSLRENKIVFITGRPDFRQGEPKLIAEQIEEIIES